MLENIYFAKTNFLHALKIYDFLIISIKFTIFSLLV